MSYRDVVVLIPSHSLEDFPTEQGERPAASLLNAFAVAYHPAWLAGMSQLPRWHRADDPPQPHAEQLVIIPEVCDGWLPHDWVNEARGHGAVVLDQMHERTALVDAALAPIPHPELDADLVADFLALGTCWLQIELLTRHMRNFGNIDEIRFQNRVIAAAKAVVADDRESATAHLKSAFEILLEARERFYPVDCYLIDLCLITPDVADDHLLTALNELQPFNLLLPASDLEQIAVKRPDIIAALRAATTAGRLEVLGGEYRETPVPLLPLSSRFWELDRGRAAYREHLQGSPSVWGRRRYGLAAQWPQLLQRSGYTGALHVVLDDGIYPDAEHARLRWQGCDGTVLEAFSRIPLAADGAGSYLRFPIRMAESMDNDHVAAIAFARWPEVKSPWFDDLHRMAKYAPVLGKWITFEQLFQTAASPGKLCAYGQKEYFSPQLIQHVARRQADPLSRYARHVQRRHRFDAVDWCRTVTNALQSRPIADVAARALEADLELNGPDKESPSAEWSPSLTDAEAAWPRGLAELILSRAPTDTSGWLAINPCSFPRRTTLTLTAPDRPDRVVTVDLPACGFVWISGETPPPAAEPSRKTPAKKSSPDDAWVLAHDRLEVTFNQATGGIARIRHPHKREDRLSQLVSFRFPRERKIDTGEQGQPPLKTFYADTRCLGSEVLRSDGPIQEFATWGEIVDQLQSQALAKFRQVTRVFRSRPVIEIDVDLSDVTVPDGDPWNNYFCLRFAWPDSTATVTRCVLDGAQAFLGERFESTGGVEIASESERTTIVPHGLPFHRQTGPRMLDTLLVVAGETERRFRCTVVLDQPYLLEATRDVLSPVFVQATISGPPRSGTQGWLFHLDARNVQLLKLLDLANPSGEADDEPESWRTLPGFAVRLLETEGNSRPVRLRTFRQPVFARTRDLLGETRRELPIDGDAVLIDLGAYELADVELRFAAT
jgi:alpha-mannosidase